MFWAALYKDNNKWQRQIKLKLHKFLLRVRPDCEMDGPLKQFAGHTRHAILHGEALDYGTERTTMQAVSLLGYCVTLKTLAE